jgi:hypothetical protein
MCSCAHSALFSDVFLKEHSSLFSVFFEGTFSNIQRLNRNPEITQTIRCSNTGIRVAICEEFNGNLSLYSN